MSLFTKRIRRAFRRYGIVGVLTFTAERAASAIARMRSSVRKEIRERRERAAAFDSTYGVDTIGRIHQVELGVKSPNQLHAVAYGASDPKYFRDAIRSLPIDYGRFVFIDFGSGKGRALILASEFQFKRVVGVEFSEILHRTALKNIEKYRNHTSRADIIESICIDASLYQLPDDPLVCYFLNPFDQILMSQVLSNIQESLFRNKREIFIVYYNPRQGHLFDQDPGFLRIGTIGPVRIWRTN